MKKIHNIETIAQNYKALFCDIWGVVHNGIEVYEEAVKALGKLNQNGKEIIFITNSPRSNLEIEQQLKKLNLYEDIYDAIVTSGDSTRSLLEQAPSRLFHIGSQRELSIIDGLDVELVEDNEAQAILCTGLFDNSPNELTAYEDILLKAKSRNLPFICANPDIQVLCGEQLLYCAGALAKLYVSMGGKALIAGKPHSSIYELAFSKLKANLSKEDILAIGDGLLTDIKGAHDYGLDAVFILDGVNKQHLMRGQDFDDVLVQDYVKSYNFSPLAYMEKLC